MKKLFKILAFLVLIPVLLILAAAIIIPIFFKEDIKKALDETIVEYVDAKVDYDENSLSLSLFSDFPNVQVGIQKLNIVGNKPFKGDTLLSVQEFKVSLDIKSVLTDNLQINGILLDKPRVMAQVNEDGVPNWDIVIAQNDSITTKEDTSSTALETKIDDWEIKNGYISYNDEVFPMLAYFDNLNHKGSGSFGSVIDILTTTSADKAYLKFDGTTYLNNVALNAEFNLEKDDNKYTFKENNIKLNDLDLKFDGYTALEEDDIEVDMEFGAEENTFKNLISLVPAVFLKGYEQVEANGTFVFDGMVKGHLKGDVYPGFDINLLVKEGDFKHPDLPSKISDINFDLNLNNESGVLNNTTIDAKGILIKMGDNIIDGRVLIEGIEDYYVDTDMKAKVNLDEVKNFYPLDGNVLKGILDMKIAGKGKVDVENQQFPALNGYINLFNGFVKTKDINIPLEKINFKSQFRSDGSTKGTNLDVQDIALLLDGDAFGGKVSIQDFDAINYDADLNGKINLGKLMDIFPVDGMTLAGIININEFKTKGSMEAVDAENYQALITSGNASISDLSYVDDSYLPNGLKITSSNIRFTPEKIMLDSYKGFVGKNDVSINGNISNYMGYLFGHSDTTLGGQMNLVSQKFDVNPFMSDETVEPSEGISEDESVALIPTDIHFIMNATMNELIYDDLTLTNFNGGLEIVDGMVKMENINFKTLGASFKTSGTYDTRIANNPKFDFALDVVDMPIKEAFTYFNVVQQLSPMAKTIDGIVNTSMQMKGSLLDGYMPDMNTLNMDGDLDIIEAVANVTDIKILSGISSKTKLKNVNQYKIKNEKLNIKVKEGMLWVSPFTMSGNGTLLTAQINSGLADNSINHHMTMDAPSSSLTSGISSLGLNSNAIGDRIEIDFDIIGTSTNPKVDIKKSISNSVKDKVTTEVKDRLDDKKDEAEAKAKAEADRIKKEAEAKAKAEKERIRKAAEAKAKAEAEKAKQKAADKVKDALKDKIPGWGK